MNSERGKLVRRSEPPLVYRAHSTAGADQAFVKKAFGGLCVEN